MSAVTDVLIAGAGPVGLTLAHELLRRGVRVRVVDAAAGPSATSRALATHARTLEIYDQMGVVGDILARGRKAQHFSIHRGGPAAGPVRPRVLAPAHPVPVHPGHRPGVDRGGAA
ncbi:FAD-dependent oxidoreductase [Streptomyces somaliensis]|uniref:FAD-dependent oxidoreductase n=1 Tax=Streptomyces somaliensis TaxID=78355 RepID=UPI0020CF34F3|nr:FAD-dependent oxidoreductase [Streptomyces somaliensis]